MSSGSDRSFVTGGEASPRHVKARDMSHTSWASSPRNSPRSKQRRPEDSDTKKMVCNFYRVLFNDGKVIIPSYVSLIIHYLYENEVF